ncbi:MAG TPA: hypothetical protein VNK81_04375, partial [Thermodesulfobacteriota bacterium]|nr:hypothetical protein [Thermodesulfobacteriota bacterium]
MRLLSYVRNRPSTLTVPTLFLVSFLIYYATTEGHPTPYNSFVRLADALLHGRLHLKENITWLELVHIDGKYYIVPPPMPAVLLLPFVAIFGLSINQTTASVLLGSLNVSLAFLVVGEMTRNLGMRFWATVMFGFGTIHWWVATAGGVWTFSQVTSVAFLFLAIYATFKDKHPFLVGVLLGASYWSRLPTILSLPFFIAMSSDRWLKKTEAGTILSRINPGPMLYLGLGVSIFIGLNSIYNLLRFGTPLDRSYYLIPGIMEEPWFKKG